MGPVLVAQGYLSLNLGLGLAEMLLPGAVVLGQGVSSMSWSAGVSVSSKSWGICGFRPGFSSSLLDLYSEKSLSWSWAGGGAGSGGRAVFFAGLAGLGLDEDPDGAGGALAKPTCLSIGSEMVAICGEQVLPGVCSRPFREQGGVPVLQGQGRQRVISPLPKIKGWT